MFQLDTILQQAFPSITSHDIQNTIVQGNAQSFLLDTTDTSLPHNTQRPLFVKQVSAEIYKSKSWPDLRRTLLYARTEVRFYKDVLPQLQRNEEEAFWNIAPECHLANYHLEDLIDESESATSSSVPSMVSYTEDDYDVLQNKGGYLVLESLQDGYYQTSPLTLTEVQSCLDAIAKFHASAYEQPTLLKAISSSLCEYAGSYHLYNRNPKELDQIDQSWQTFMNNFKSVAPTNFFASPEIQSLGQRIQKIAHHVARELSPSHEDSHACIVHGDFKSMNIFLPQESTSDSKEAILIDFASTGLGLGMSDVAMHMTHALPPWLIEGHEMELVEGYLSSLKRALPLTKEYPKDVALRHYKYAVVDYFRFVLGRFWKSATVDNFESRKNSKNVVLVNRNLEAALSFIVRAEGYLKEIEVEMDKAL